VLVTEDKKLISASIKEGVSVLSYKDFLLEVGLKI
jgi:predicted nucleic acid-binding protein